MEPNIIVAIIGAIATIMASLIGYFSGKRKEDATSDSVKAEKKSGVSIGEMRGRSKNIRLNSSSAGAILQEDKIENLHLQQALEEKEIRDSLKLVDVSIEERENENPRIDIKVRNIGNKVAYLKKAEFQIMKMGIIRVAGVRFEAIPVTWTYDVGVSKDNTPYTKTISISQSVGPNEVDRFQFVIGTEYMDVYVSETLVYMKIILFYNETDEQLITPPMLLSIPMPKSILGMTTGYPDLEVRKSNIRIASTMVKLPGIRSTRIQAIEKALKQ